MDSVWSTPSGSAGNARRDTATRALWAARVAAGGLLSAQHPLPLAGANALPIIVPVTAAPQRRAIGTYGRSQHGRGTQKGTRWLQEADQHTRQYLLARFWEAALGFWRTGSGSTAWLLTLAVIAIALVDLGMRYRLNLWHRAMFDALDTRDGSGVLSQSMLYFPSPSDRRA